MLLAHDGHDHVFCSSFKIKCKATNFHVVLAVFVARMEVYYI